MIDFRKYSVILISVEVCGTGVYCFKVTAYFLQWLLKFGLDLVFQLLESSVFKKF